MGLLNNLHQHSSNLELMNYSNYWSLKKKKKYTTFFDLELFSRTLLCTEGIDLWVLIFACAKKMQFQLLFVCVCVEEISALKLF